MIKIYKKLTAEQKARGVVFSSTLSTEKTERKNDTIHEVLKNDSDQLEVIRRLKDDKFFNDSQWRYNIIRK